MSEEKRLHRTDPSRIGPIRSFSNLWNSAQAFGPSAKDSDAVQATKRAEGNVPVNPVTEAVDLGYRVIEDYLRDGRRAAGELNRRPYGSHSNGNDVAGLVDKIVRNYTE